METRKYNFLRDASASEKANFVRAWQKAVKAAEENGIDGIAMVQETVKGDRQEISSIATQLRKALAGTPYALPNMPKFTSKKILSKSAMSDVFAELEKDS